MFKWSKLASGKYATLDGPYRVDRIGSSRWLLYYFQWGPQGGKVGTYPTLAAAKCAAAERAAELRTPRGPVRYPVEVGETEFLRSRTAGDGFPRRKVSHYAGAQD